MEKINERLVRLRKFLGLKQAELADRLDITQSYVSGLEKGHRELSSNVLTALREAFNVSTDWLMTGQGDMILPSEGNPVRPMPQPPTLLTPQVPVGAMPQNTVHQRSMATPAPVSPPQTVAATERLLTVTVDADNEPAIALVPVKAQAGYANQRVQTEFFQQLPVLRLPDYRFRHGTFRAFEIAGDSMEPTLFGNDITICRFVEDWRWLRDHELYVVVMKEDVLVKRVRNHINRDQSLDLVSDNSFYPPLNVPVTEVVEVWQVVARITSHLPSPPRSLRHDG